MSTDRVQNQGIVRRTAWAGLGVNLLVCVLKTVGGVLGQSQALLADAVHTLSDIISDIAILIGLRYWDRPPDARHPHGHRRFETIVTIGIGLALAGAGIGIAIHALERIESGVVDHPDWLALIAVSVSLILKEGIYRWTVWVGRMARSPSLVANAWHHRSDALSSIPVLAAVAIAIVKPSWNLVDPIGAVLVSVLIIHAAGKILWQQMQEVVETAAPEEVVRQIEEVARQVPRVLCVHMIRTRYLSGDLAVDLHISVDGEMSVRDGHDVARETRRQIIDQIDEVIDVIVHLEPYPCEDYRACCMRSIYQQAKKRNDNK